MILDAPADLTGRTVCYGGSFDPPHLGHQMACLYMLEALKAAAVWLIPCSAHPHQKQMAPFAHRVAMCQRLSQTFDKRVHVSTIEQTLASPSYTYATLLALKRQYPQNNWVLAIGADLVAQLPRWHCGDQLLQHVDVLVLGRNGFVPVPATPALPNFSSSDIRQRLHQKRSVFGMVPHGVYDYIATEKLYRD